MSSFSGVINNGLERGWSKQEIRTSLLNAGYPQNEIDAELSSFNGTISNPVRVLQPEPQDTRPLNKYQTPNVKSKKKIVMIFLIVFLSILLIAGIVFGAYYFL